VNFNILYASIRPAAIKRTGTLHQHRFLISRTYNEPPKSFSAYLMQLQMGLVHRLEFIITILVIIVIIIVVIIIIIIIIIIISSSISSSIGGVGSQCFTACRPLQF